MIRIWQSYACNNSAAYRLISRFGDAETARTVATELTEFFDAQMKLGGRRPEDGALSTLSRTYGFDWEDGAMQRDRQGPSVFVEGAMLIVYHPSCLGLGPGIPAYLADRGAVADHASRADLRLSVLFRARPGVDPQLDEELATIFAQLPKLKEEGHQWFVAPWSRYDAHGRFALFRDAGTVGMWFPVSPPAIAGVRTWLASHGIEKFVTQFEEPTDEQLFLALAAARCTACEGLLEYLDPRLHDIEKPQLVCQPCGGLYDVTVFT